MTRALRTALLTLSVVALAAVCAANPAAQRDAGPLQVGVLLDEWQDAARQRTVPVKVYYPEGVKGPFPVIVFSHGLGGTRETYEYLGRHWASHGYVSVHLQHKGSDDAVWRGNPDPGGSLRRSAANLQNAVDRARDVRFALDRLAELNAAAAGPLARRLDLARIGVAGHSFGAWTALAVAGQGGGPRGGARFRDPRVKAAVAMSAPVPGGGQRGARGDFDAAYREVQIPVLHMTGTLDTSPLGLIGAASDRRIPFDHIRGVDQYLVTFEGGDHMIFSGRPRVAQRTGHGEKDAEFQTLIRWGSTVFWDAYLKDDAASKSWLAGGGYAAALGKDAKLEVKAGH